MDVDVDPDDVFRDEEDDPDNDFYERKDASKEFIVYLVDASPKMFETTVPGDNEKNESHFHIALSCMIESLKTQIISRSYDEVAICFFNTREKKNLQDLNGVYVYNVAEREDLDRPTARLIKEFSCIEESFKQQIGSQYGIISGARENSLYNALWVAQALLRKGSARTADKRIFLFTNEDDPFGGLKGAVKADMIRTTLQRAKDAQDLSISIELLPLSCPDVEFDVSILYDDLIGLEDGDHAQYMQLAGLRLESMKDDLRKRMFTKRVVRRIRFFIANGLSIDLNTYAMIRPTVPGTITWLDSVSNRPIKTERSLVCGDTGALIQESTQRFVPYKNENVKFSMDEISEIKRLSTGQLRLLGFKPLSCLKEYHNLRPSTFLYPSDQEVVGSTCIFIALHRSMLQLKRYAVAFYGASSNPRLVALIAQDEVVEDASQIEPPGMQMIYLPYCDDIRDIEEDIVDSNNSVTRASEDQIKNACAVVKRLDLGDFTVTQVANTALQRHYAVLQALALEEDEIPQMKDDTLPDEEGFSRPGVVKAIEEFKLSVYGENYDKECDLLGDGNAKGPSKKRKAAGENAAEECSKYDWPDLADNGKLKNLTVTELKYYLTAHNLPVAGKKEALISRILTHMGK